MAVTPIDVAVIGAGHIGRHHTRIFAELPGARLVAVADPNPDVEALAARHGARWFADHHQMLEVIGPRAVVVAAPTRHHLVLGLDVLDAGAALLVEKPIAGNLDDADALIERAATRGQLLAVGHVERFNPMVTRVKEVIDQGSLGAITAVMARRVGGFPAREPDGDVVTDLAVHDLDIIAYALGEELELIGSQGSRTHHSSQLDSVQILCAAGQTSAFVEANWITPVKVRTLTVTGSDGYLEGNYVTQELTWYEMEARRPQLDFADFVARFGTPTRQAEQVPVREPLALQAAAFVAAVVDGDARGLVLGPAARRALSLAIRARDSAAVPTS